MASFTLRPLKLCLLLFEIISSLDSTGGTIWAVFIVEIILSVDITSGTVWAVFIVV